MKINSKNLRRAAKTVVAISILSQPFNMSADIREVDLRVGGETVALNFSPSQTEYEVIVPYSGTFSFSCVPDKADDIITVNFNGKEFTDHSVSTLPYGESRLCYTVKSPSSATEKAYTFNIKAESMPLCQDPRSLSIYQIMVASFLHGEGGAPGYQKMWNSPEQRKDGNLRGVIEALPYIKKLGMNAIWMTPIFDSSDTLDPNFDPDLIRATGYFISDYFNIDPHFGTLEEFKELISTAHSLGLYVFLDGPFGQHGGVTKPSPWGHTLVSSDVPIKNNMGNYSYTPAVVYPESMDYFKDVIRYWSAFGIDGWRLDSAAELCVHGHNYWEDMRAVQIEECQKRIDNGEKWGTFGYMLAEDWGDPQHLPTVSEGGLDCVMDTWYHWSILDIEKEWNIENFKKLAANDPNSRNYRPGVTPAAFLSNHDKPRIIDRIGNNRDHLRMMHAALVGNSQTVINFYGDEFGDHSGTQVSPGAWDNCGRVSGHLEPNNSEEAEMQKDVTNYYNLRLQHPALWRGNVSSTEFDNGLIVTKVDPETEETIHIVFPFGDGTCPLPGPCTDLISGASVEGAVEVTTDHPVFLLAR